MSSGDTRPPGGGAAWYGVLRDDNTFHEAGPWRDRDEAENWLGDVMNAGNVLDGEVVPVPPPVQRGEACARCDRAFGCGPDNRLPGVLCLVCENGMDEAPAPLPVEQTIEGEVMDD